MSERARVVVVEDHPLYRQAVVALVGELAWPVVGAFGDLESALPTVAEADLVVLDLGLPGTDGVEAVRAVRAANPAVRVLVLTMTDDPAVLGAAVRAGATGYLVKGAEPEDITRALTGTVRGQAVFEQALATSVFERAGHAVPDTAVRAFPSLTERELDVLELVAAGRSNAEIARTLVLSEKTARNHVSNILTKLGLTRSEAIARARDAGLGRGHLG
ncbi:response regulator [Nocardioides coralli]|uniref:response regulator n=1 Tax=Nocardioides coralli TaxID=2872154 RepID=UPI001CA46CBF|nr:response regulator transcription factor [Nocardioides coralli]QZY28404.1 response regulator transcription factor [Nocardioides coralli]